MGVLYDTKSHPLTFMPSMFRQYSITGHCLVRLSCNPSSLSSSFFGTVLVCPAGYSDPFCMMGIIPEVQVGHGVAAGSRGSSRQGSVDGDGSTTPPDSAMLSSSARIITGTAAIGELECPNTVTWRHSDCPVPICVHMAAV